MEDYEKLLGMEEILELGNLAEYIEEVPLLNLGMKVHDYYLTDKRSREDWERKYLKWQDMAGQRPDFKTKPWRGAANVKYPLVSNAALQFHARVTPALMPNKEPVGSAPIGPDPTGEKRALAQMVSSHMNYQLTTEIEEWEGDFDSMLMALSVSGHEYKKTYYDPIKRRMVSKHVTPLRLVVNYWADKDFSDIRKTEVFYYNKNQLEEKIRSGQYATIDWEKTGQPFVEITDEMEAANHERVGMTEPSTIDSASPYLVLEHHGWCDLDGDGYEEPYIITILEKTKQVLALTPRFTSDDILLDEDENIIRINPIESYTKYGFIPNPDGSFYDIGFGHLLYHLNSVANTGINMLLDSGTLNNIPGGFLGRGLKMKKGEFQFHPGKWFTLNASGDDIKKSIAPLPVNQPSQVMLSLVQYIIDAGNRLASTTEVMSGELPGQNTKTGAYQAAIDQGQKVFTAIYKRIRRSLEQELRKMYKLNGYILASGQDTLPARSAQVFGVTPELYQADLFYIQPSADPNIAIKEQQLAKDQQVIQTLAGFGLSQGIPEAIRRYFSTLEVENVESVLPANQQLPDPNAAAQAQAQIEAQDKEARFGLEKEKFEWQKLVDISESAHKADSTKVDLLKVDGSLQAKGLELGKSLVELRAKAEENDKQREVDNGAAQQGGVPSVEAGEDNQVVDGMGPGGGARDSQ